MEEVEDQSRFKAMLDVIFEHGKINFNQLTLADTDVIRCLIEIYSVECFSEYFQEFADGVLDRRPYGTRLTHYLTKFQAMAERMGLDSSPIYEVSRILKPRILKGFTEFTSAEKLVIRKYKSLYYRIYAIFFEDWLCEFPEHEQLITHDSGEMAPLIDPFIDLDLFLDTWKDAFLVDPTDAATVIRAIANDPNQRPPQVIMKADFKITKGLSNIWGKFKTRMKEKGNIFCIKEDFGRRELETENKK